MQGHWQQRAIQFQAVAARWVGVLVLLLCGLGGIGASTWADQGTGGYPWADATASGLFSDWFIDKDGDGRRDPDTETHDNNGYSYRNCTSFVAWKLERLGLRVPYGKALGHAKNWDDNARLLGYAVDNEPRVGDAAVWNGGKYGHVAYVEAVDNRGTDYNGDDLVTISEYNAMPRYGGRYSSRAGVRADAYIHFLPAAGSAVVPDEIQSAVVTVPPAEQVASQEPIAEVLGVSTGEPAEVKGGAILTAETYLLADINNDQSADVIAVLAATDTAAAAIAWRLSETETRQRTILPELAGSDVRWLPGDVTGDGLTDLVAVLRGQTAWDVYVLRGVNGELSAPEIWGTFTANGDDSSVVLLGDHNRDNRADIYLVRQTGRGDSRLYWLEAVDNYFSTIQPI